ncbi:hypothetical protein D3Z52_12345 [Clostridiaceae bacterium]|nr:hypothetical protein [Clostridiaceae bacterium]NBI83013.1 hypothetical protein [Clostridiaceae bacterium]
MPLSMIALNDIIIGYRIRIIVNRAIRLPFVQNHSAATKNGRKAKILNASAIKMTIEPPTSPARKIAVRAHHFSCTCRKRSTVR